jgi:hypothetical protein
MNKQVEAYIRLPQEHTTENVDTLVLNLAPDHCLDELAVLNKALSPKYVSLVYVHSKDGTTYAYQWLSKSREET